jgi:hypothetical protein
VRGINTEPIFTVTFSLADITRSLPDLVTTVRIYTSITPSAPDPSSLISTGYVERLGWDGDEATLHVSPMVGLKTQRLGGFAVFGVAPGELFWTLARLGGFAPTEIKIGDVWPPPSEDFFVVTPVEGIKLDFAEQVGDVTFTPDRGLRAQWKTRASNPHVAGNEYLDEFRATTVAALTTVRASLVLDAERVGVSRIEAATARLALVSRHSRPVSLNGKARPFSHERLQERVRVRRIVGVLSKDSQRQWIRGLDNSQDEIVVTSGELLGMRDALAASLDARTSEAIRAWRRAALAAEPAAAVVALAEALEFYAAGTSVESLFSAQDLDVAKHAVLAGATWSDAQSKRLADLLSRANEAPFFVRLRASVTADGLELSTGEADLLRNLRDQRNDLLHGRERRDPQPDELTAGLALVGRLLVARLTRLPRSS